MCPPGGLGKILAGPGSAAPHLPLGWAWAPRFPAGVSSSGAAGLGRGQLWRRSRLLCARPRPAWRYGEGRRASVTSPAPSGSLSPNSLVCTDGETEAQSPTAWAPGGRTPPLPQHPVRPAQGLGGGGGGFCRPQSLCLVLTGGEGLTAHGDSKGLALSLSGGRKHAARGLGLAPPRKKPGLVAGAPSVNQG